MVSTRLSLWLEFPLAVAIFSWCFSTVDAKFLLQKSCGKETRDELTINSRTWIKTGEEEAVVKANLEKIHFFPNSLYLIRKNGETLTIEGPSPSRNRKTYPGINVIRMESGDVLISCRSNKSKARKELDEAEWPSHPFPNVPLQATTPSGTSDSSQPRGRSLPLDPDGRGSPVASTSSPTTTIKTEFIGKDSTTISISLQNQTKFESTVIIDPKEHTTPRPRTAGEPTFPQNTTLAPPSGKPTVVVETTISEEPIPTTDSTAEEEKTNEETTELASSSPETSTLQVVIRTTHEESSTYTTESHSTTTDAVTLGTRTSMNESTTQIIPTTMAIEGNSSATKAEDLSGKPWSLKDHVLYIAIGATLLFVMILVIMTICIVQRMKKTRIHRLPDNNEDFFIPSAYENALLRDSVGGGEHNNDVRMMYSEVDPDDLPPTELEERVLRTITMDTREPERPKCLVKFSSEENIGPL